MKIGLKEYTNILQNIVEIEIRCYYVTPSNPHLTEMVTEPFPLSLSLMLLSDLCTPSLAVPHHLTQVCQAVNFLCIGEMKAVQMIKSHSCVNTLSM